MNIYLSHFYLCTVRSLLQNGVDPNIGNEDGLTALHQVIGFLILTITEIEMMMKGLTGGYFWCSNQTK